MTRRVGGWLQLHPARGARSRPRGRGGPPLARGPWRRAQRRRARGTYSLQTEAAAPGVQAPHAAKTVVLHDANGHRLAVIPAWRRLDFYRVREVAGGTVHMRLATEHEMTTAFSAFEGGALPPFGPMVPAPEVVDPHLGYH